MKRLLLVGISCIGLALLSNFASAREVADKIVAVVNRGIITQTELETRMGVIKNNLNQQQVEIPSEDILRQQVLERLINERLQLELARKTGIRLEDAQLEKTLDRIAEQNKINREQLFASLQQQGLSPEQFREQIRTEVLLSRLREREVDSRINISEAEVDAFLKQQGDTKTEYHIAHILIQIPEDANFVVLSEKRKKAEKALADIQAGLAFNAAAAKYSEFKDALDGGDMGWRTSARLPDFYLKAAQQLQANQTSGIIKSPNGFHLVHLIETRAVSNSQIITKTHARHILIKISDAVTEADAKTRIDQIYERLQHKAKFEELARVYSEDVSAAKGGDLGWLNPGDTVPDFEKAMDATKIGEFSAPVKSQFGWHIILPIERKTEDVGPQRERMQAKIELRSKRGDELADEWLRQLRDSSYVDIRL